MLFNPRNTLVIAAVIVIILIIIVIIKKIKAKKCTTNADCTITKNCVSGKCIVGCGNNPLCVAPQQCINGKCVNCDNALLPCPASQQCINTRCAESCNNNELLCIAPQQCVNGSCVLPTPPANCSIDSDCGESYYKCVSNKCTANVTDPPFGYMTEGTFSVNPGDLWPPNVCMPPPFTLPIFLVSSSCSAGQSKGLINRGGGKCTNLQDNNWSECQYTAI